MIFLEWIVYLAALAVLVGAVLLTWFMTLDEIVHALQGHTVSLGEVMAWSAFSIVTFYIAWEFVA